MILAVEHDVEQFQCLTGPFAVVRRNEPTVALEPGDLQWTADDIELSFKLFIYHHILGLPYENYGPIPLGLFNFIRTKLEPKNAWRRN